MLSSNSITSLLATLILASTTASPPPTYVDRIVEIFVHDGIVCAFNAEDLDVVI
jgi:hypothetical protein